MMFSILIARERSLFVDNLRKDIRSATMARRVIKAVTSCFSITSMAELASNLGVQTWQTPDNNIAMANDRHQCGTKEQCANKHAKIE